MAGNNIDIKAIWENMQRAVENEIPRMPEGAFKEIFLPMFVDQNNNTHHQVMANWVQISGSPFKSVHVVDDNDRSKILFTVPPISERSALNNLEVTDKDGNPLQTIAHVIDTYGKLQGTGPGVAENYLNEQLNKRFELMRNTPDYIKNYQAWKEIFARYGKGELLETKEAVAAKPSEGTAQDVIEDC